MNSSKIFNLILSVFLFTIVPFHVAYGETCEVPAMGETLSPAPYNLTVTLPSGQYSGRNVVYVEGKPVEDNWSGYIASGSYPKAIFAGHYTGTNGAGCSWDFTVVNENPIRRSVPAIGATFDEPYTLTMTIPPGHYSGFNSNEVLNGGNWEGDIGANWNGFYGYIYSRILPAGHYTGTNGTTGSLQQTGDECKWDFTVKKTSYTAPTPVAEPVANCAMPPIGAVYQAPYALTMAVPSGQYHGYNSVEGNWSGYIAGVVTQGFRSEEEYRGNYYTRIVPAGHYTGTNDAGCNWDFTVVESNQLPIDNTGAGTTGATNVNVGGGASQQGQGTIDGGGSGASSQIFTHYKKGQWSVCTGYNISTGQGGTQTRTVSSYVDNIGPSDSQPPSSQSCTMPPDFNFLLSSTGESGSVILGNVYSTFVTFIGGQQSALSVPVQITVSPSFASYINPPDLSFAVTNVSPALPSGVSYTFTPNPLSPSQYAQGTSFVANVPQVSPGVYIITAEASGGGIVKQATIKMNVNVVNPTFLEI